MKYEIESNTEGIAIEVSEIEGKGKRLLKAFQECQEGRCSCPTDEYSKLDSLKIEQSEGKLSLQLKAKKGQKFNTTDIEKCLDHTDKQVGSSE